MSPREDMVGFADVVEWFSLRKEARLAASVADDKRSDAAVLWERSCLQRTAAAERWLGGREPDALEMLVAACASGREAAALLGLAVEATDDDASRTLSERYGALSLAHDRIARVVRGPVRSRSGRWTVRVLRVVLPLLLLVGVFNVAYRVRRFVHPIASATFGPKWDARYAVDGRTDTAWIAPDGVAAWLDLELMPPRPVKSVRLHDTRNPPHDDREIKEFRLEFWRDGRAVDSVEGSFPGGDKPGWVRIPVNRDWKVEKVRFVIKSFLRKGGGLAEIQVQ